MSGLERGGDQPRTFGDGHHGPSLLTPRDGGLVIPGQTETALRSSPPVVMPQRGIGSRIEPRARGSMPIGPGGEGEAIPVAAGNEPGKRTTGDGNEINTGTPGGSHAPAEGGKESSVIDAETARKAERITHSPADETAGRQISEEERSFIGGPTGGIPRAELMIPGARDITGRSGRLLHVEITPLGEATSAEINIKAVDGPQHFRADANSMNGMMRLFILNEDQEGNRHPDLFARRLIETSVGWF